MKIFAFDPSDYRDRYEAEGWLHIKGGVDPEFLAYLQDFVAGRFQEQHVEGRAIGGAKDQALFEFPDSVRFPDELFDVVAGTCGLNRPTMTLSERHIKAYDADAHPDPPAHKDRLASQVSMGLSIDVPAGSYLVVYPHDHRGLNPFNVSAAFRSSLDPEERPEVILKDAREVVIEDEPGDVMLFPGNDVWHLRRNPANVVNLYLKFNDFNSDPLGEDPFTDVRRQKTLEYAASADSDLDSFVPFLARRMDTVQRQYTRNGWGEILIADVWGEDPVRLDESDVRLIRSVDGSRNVAALASELAGNGSDESRVRAQVLRLAQRGVLELVRADEI
jgi:hypothetical protein